MHSVSRREKQQGAIAQHLRKTKGTQMENQVSDEARVSAALGEVAISTEEVEQLSGNVDHEDFEDFEGDDFENESDFEDAEEDFEGDDEDFEGDDEGDEEDDEYDDEDEDDELDSEDDDEDDIGDDALEYALSELEQAASLVADADEVDISEIAGCSALSQLAELAVTENADVCTTLVDSSVLITIDASDHGMFDEFRRKQLTDVMLDTFDAPVNLYATLSSKKGGYLVTPIDEVLTYHSVLAESGTTTLIGRSGELQDTVNFMERAVTRATTMLANDALGVDEDDDDTNFLIMTDEMAEAYADEDDDSDLDTEKFETSMLTVGDFINVSSFVTVNDVDEEAVSSATLHTHIAVRFPALTHKSTVAKDGVAKIASQIPKLFARFQKKHPNVKLRFGVTMKSTDVIRGGVGAKLSKQLMDLGLAPYNYNEVNFTDAVFPLQSESSYDTSVANSVFTFGGDVLYIANAEQPVEEAE